MPSETSGLRKTPLHDLMLSSGARLVDFAGWEMPVQFTSVIEEHLAVREKAGLFDVSHMGEVAVRGKGSLTLLQRLTPNDVARLEVGQAQYTALLTPRATFVDDVLIYKRKDDAYLLCVNAANTEKDFRYLRENASAETQVEDVSADYGQIALQGPRAATILTRLAGTAVERLPSYRFIETTLNGSPVLISRTGYTGEDGFEIYCAPAATVGIWESLMEAGKGEGLRPCGLGARDTLRLEARLPLYGNDIDETVTPLEAGLSFIVKLEKGEFLGSAVLKRQREEGVVRRLVGFELTERGIPRHGYPLRVAGRDSGAVTSGTFAPFLKKSIGLGYVPAEHSMVGREIRVEIRGSEVPGKIVKTPFYQRRA